MAPAIPTAPTASLACAAPRHE
ncbi:hypothetical protein A2U01_0100930, partial [Trifolium medium]|nr:hypothetical protein [Trifolium medium]